MRVAVVWGTGAGRTELGAFDAALADAGIGNYNLMALSSVVPPDAEVVTVGTHGGDYYIGAPVGVVLAAAEAARGERAAAGLGWTLAAEGGVLMEACEPSADDCRATLDAALADARAVRDWDWRVEAETVVRTVAPDADAGRGAAVVAAVFGPLDTADDWPATLG